MQKAEGKFKEAMEKFGPDQKLGVPDLIDRVADESVGTPEEEILPFLQEKKHPALEMDPIM